MCRMVLTILLGMYLSLTGCSTQMAGGVDIWKAVEQSDGAAIKRFAMSGGDMNVLDHNGSTPLWIALTEENRDSYEALLKSGADPNVIMSGKRVVTHWAAMQDDVWWLQLALEHGADPNLVNVGRGRPLEGPPLKAAISNGTLDHVKLLVEHGADVNEPDHLNCDPLANAAAQNKFNIVLYLLDQGADYTRSQCSGITFLTDIREKCENKIQWFRLKEDREGLDAIRTWLEAQGVQINGE